MPILSKFYGSKDVWDVAAFIREDDAPPMQQYVIESLKTSAGRAALASNSQFWLFLAAREGSNECLTVLLNHAADLSYTKKDFESALDGAKENENDDSIRLLQQHIQNQETDSTGKSSTKGNHTGNQQTFTLKERHSTMKSMNYCTKCKCDDCDLKQNEHCNKLQECMNQIKELTLKNNELGEALASNQRQCNRDYAWVSDIVAAKNCDQMFGDGKKHLKF